MSRVLTPTATASSTRGLTGAAADASGSSSAAAAPQRVVGLAHLKASAAATSAATTAASTFAAAGTEARRSAVAGSTGAVAAQGGPSYSVASAVAGPDAKLPSSKQFIAGPTWAHVSTPVGRTRMLEALNMWMSLPSTAALVRDLIAGATSEASAGSTPRLQTPHAPPSQPPAVRPRGNSGSSSPTRGSPRGAALPASERGDDASMPLVTIDDGFVRPSAAGPSSPVRMKGAPATSPSAAGSGSTAASPLARKGMPTTPTRSPRPHLQPQVQHVVDEMDLAHRVGALSPRPGDLTLSNSGNGAGLVSGGGGSAPGSARGGASSNFSPNQSGANVTEGGLLGVRGTGPGPYAAVRSPLERPLSTSPSPTRAEPPGADGVSGSGAESPSTGSRPGSSSGAATYGHAASIKAAVDLAQTRGPAARVPLASMQDIPAFYFPSVANGGRLAHAAAREKALAAVSATQAPAAAAPAPAPSEKQPPSGIIGRGAGWAPPALGAKAAAAAAAAGANAATAAADAAIAQLQQQQQQELASLNRVVAALTAPPAKAKAGSKAGKPKAPPSALSVAVQLTTETFGLPGVFAKIVHARLVQITQQLAAATGAVPAASGGATSKAAAAQFTAAAARAFYESHIIDRTIERRMYDVLLGAGDLNFPVPAASTVQLTFPGPAGAVKAKKGVAPSAAAPGSGRTSLNRGDFSPLLQILLDHHPGLNFLKGTPDFQARYLEAVTIRIFYELDRYDTGRISWEDFRRSTLPAAIRKVDSSEDINAVLEYFSYEHFYVLYCRFWDLDGNKDFLVTKDDLSRYFSENTANPEVVERIVNGVGRPLRSGERGKMNFEDFVWFCLSEENKAHPRAISYFFRILDVDGDGVISGFELEHFYAHTREKMLEITTEAISYEDVTCQIADMMVCAASATVTAAGAGHHGAADGAASIAAGAGARRRSASAPAFPLAALGNTTITSVTSPTEMATTPPPGHRGAQPASTVANGSILHAGYTLADFLRCPQAAYVAINMLTNVSKFLLFEQRDPFVTQEKGSVGNNPEGAAAAAVEKTEWDRFCRTEYDRMAAEDPMS